MMMLMKKVTLRVMMIVMTMHADDEQYKRFIEIHDNNDNVYK